MATKLIYFRSQKQENRQDLDVDLELSFSYEILDKSIPACTQLTVPSNLTVFYEKTPSRLSNSDNNVGCKLCVFLVGCDQCPDNMIISSPVDRIEFHGSIGYEKPVFEMIHRLPEVKKVKFFLGHKQLPSFVECNDKHSWVNGSVTSLNIIVEKIGSNNKTRKEKDMHRLKVTLLEKIVLRILKRSATSFPNLRKITMEVPNSKKIQGAVNGLIEKLQYLKPTLVDFDESLGMLTVKKIELPQASSSPLPKSNEITSSSVVPDIQDSSTLNLIKKESEAAEIEEESDQSDASKSSLNDLGKLLESMLGIGMGLGLGIKPKNSEESSTIVIPVLPEDNPQKVLIKLEKEKQVETDSDEADTYADFLSKINQSKKNPIAQNELSMKEEAPSEIDEQDDDQDGEDNEDDDDTLEEIETGSESNCSKQLQPMFHHPMCHDYHQYLGVPIIPGFGIGVYHYPLQQEAGSGTAGDTEFKNQGMQDKGR